MCGTSGKMHIMHGIVNTEIIFLIIQSINKSYNNINNLVVFLLLRVIKNNGVRFFFPFWNGKVNV